MNRRQYFITYFEDIVNDPELNNEERLLFQHCLSELNCNVATNKCIHDLKIKLTQLSLDHKLTDKGVACFMEISRREPNSGRAGIWNFLIRKKR